MTYLSTDAQRRANQIDPTGEFFSGRGAQKEPASPNHGAVAGGLPPGIGRTGRQAIAFDDGQADFIRPQTGLKSPLAAP
jgi:hypothetical protein